MDDDAIAVRDVTYKLVDMFATGSRVKPSSGEMKKLRTGSCERSSPELSTMEQFEQIRQMFLIHVRTLVIDRTSRI